MKSIKSFRRAIVVVSLLTVCIATGVSAANLLDNLWFKLKLSVKGEAMTPPADDVKKTAISATVYLGIAPTTNAHAYTFQYWTETSTGWTNSTTIPRTATGTNDNFYPDTNVRFDTSDKNGAGSVSTFHTIFINPKLNKDGTLKSATYTGLGEIYTGFITNGTTTNFIFGGDSLIGSTVSSNKLPFTP